MVGNNEVRTNGMHNQRWDTDKIESIELNKLIELKIQETTDKGTQKSVNPYQIMKLDYKKC